MTSNGYQRILKRVIKLKNKESLVHGALKYQFQWKLFLIFLQKRLFTLFIIYSYTADFHEFL